MIDKLELKSSHEVIDTVNVTDVESIFYCKPTDPDILTVLMKDGKRLYCDEVCPLQEEPVSNPIDFEKELYKAFGQVKDFTLGMRIAKRFYDMGKNSQEPANEELEQAIDIYLATYWGGEKEKQDWPFLKKMAIHFANWQKEQMMAKAVDGAFIRRNRYTKMNVLNGLDTTCDAIQSFKDKDKIKVLFVKED